ncbi:MAG TPA: hypothetical protein VMD03_08215 [Steroidobacteraceae bacterium]|nr:hypothetical protein [Steroidobacteraceae bacterium]
MLIRVAPGARIASGVLGLVLSIIAPCLAPRAAAADAYTGADGYSPASGVTASPITDLFDLRVSYFSAMVHTRIRLDPTGAPYGGTPLSGENDLGLARNNPTGLVELTFRMRKRNRMRVDYFDLDRSGNVTLGRTVVFGNETFDAGNAVQTTLDWKMMGFTYTHAFIQTDRFELGAGLGVHLLDADVTGSDPTLVENHETARTAAVPTVALETMWRISSRFAFTGRAQYLGATVDRVSGSLGEYHGDFQYRWQPSFALGLGYSYVRVSVASVTGSTPGRVTLSTQGPEMFVRVSF